MLKPKLLLLAFWYADRHTKKQVTLRKLFQKKLEPLTLLSVGFFGLTISAGLAWIKVYFKKRRKPRALPVDEADTNKSLAEGECTERNREPRATPVGIYILAAVTGIFLTLVYIASKLSGKKPQSSKTSR